MRKRKPTSKKRVRSSFQSSGMNRSELSSLKHLRAAHQLSQPLEGRFPRSFEREVTVFSYARERKQFGPSRNSPTSPAPTAENGRRNSSRSHGSLTSMRPFTGR